MNVWKTGDCAILTYGECIVGARVKLASRNGRSLMLAFDAVLGGYVGMMPVLKDDAGCFRDLILESVVTLHDYPPPAVHLLHRGVAACGMPGIPGGWPPGHRWVADHPVVGIVSCAACLRASAQGGVAL